MDVQGTMSDALDGYQWAVQDIISKGLQNSAVINLSLGMSLNRQL
jgi:oryzin